MTHRRPLFTWIFLFLSLLSVSASYADDFTTSNHKVLSGDFNSDSLTDIYIQANPTYVLIAGDIVIPIPVQPDIGHTLLLKQSDGSYVVDYDLTDAEIASMADWPESHTIVLGDYTGDGHIDAFLQANASSTPSVLIGAPTSSPAAPTFIETITNDTFGFDIATSLGVTIDSGDLNADNKDDLTIHHGASDHLAFVQANNKFNQPPTAANDNQAVAEKAYVDIDVLANDEDQGLIGGVQGNLSIYLPSSTSTNEHGALDVVNGKVRYTHIGGEIGPNSQVDSFTYQVSDANGASASADVSVTILPQNDNAPLVGGQNVLIVSEGATNYEDLLLGTSDIDGSGLSVSNVAVSAGHPGDYSIDGSTFTYTHNGNEAFEDVTVTFTVSDGVSNVQDSLLIQFIAQNENYPEVVSDAFSVQRGETLNADLSLNDSDEDINTSLTYTLLSSTITPTEGTLTLNQGGTFSFASNSTSTEMLHSFNYSVADSTDPNDRNISLGSAIVSIKQEVTVAPDGITAAPSEDTTVLAGSPVYDAFVSNDAAARVVIPIETLPGVSPETTPALSIAYDSHWSKSKIENYWADELLGYGWDLKGLSSIARCAPDVQGGDITMTTSDRLCLDGVYLKVVSGSYWGATSEYRLENSPFVKVLASNDGFIVKTPNGAEHEYGVASASRIAPYGSTATYKWAIQETTDVHGNSVLYQYYKDDSIGEIYPLRISYDNYDVTFEYQEKANDTLNNYKLFGENSSAHSQCTGLPCGYFFRTERHVRLHTIKTYANGYLSREYRLLNSAYSKNLLQKVQVCGNESSTTRCYAPVSFTWGTSYDSRSALTSVTDPLGAITSYTMNWTLPAATGSVPSHADTTSCSPIAYSYQNEAVKLFVQTLTKSNSLTSSSTSVWNYKGIGSVLTSGAGSQRGFLGYEGIEITDAQTSTIQTSYFNRCYPYNGTVAERSISHFDGTNTTPLNQQLIAYTSYSFNGGKSLLSLASKILNLNFEAGTEFGSSLTTNTYVISSDSLQSATTTHEIGLTATLGSSSSSWNIPNAHRIDQNTQTFSHDETNWVLNLPSSVGITQNRTTGSIDHVASPSLVGETRNSSLTYDDFGMLSTSVVFESTDTELSEHYIYDSRGNLLKLFVNGWELDERVTETSRYIDQRYPTLVKNAEGHTSTIEYDLTHGKPKSITDPNNVTTTVAYDALGRTSLVSHDDGRTVSYTYTQCSSDCENGVPSVWALLIEVDANYAPDKKIYLDALGRTIKESTQLLGTNWSHVQTTYDSSGRVAAVSQPFTSGAPVSNQFSYDEKDRVSTITRANGGVITYVRTANQSAKKHITTITETVKIPGEADATQVVTEYRNVQGQLSTVTEDANKKVDYDYQGNGWLNWVRLNGDDDITTHLVYDRAGNRKSIVEPNSGTTSFTFDGLGQVLSQTDAKLQTIAWEYDVLGRVLSETIGGEISSWTYDSNSIGRIASKSTNDFYETYSYDSFGRLTDIDTTIDYASTSASFALEQTYNSVGQLSTVEYPSEKVFSYTYENGHLKKVLQGNTSLHEVTSLSAYGNASTETFMGSIYQTTTPEASTGRVKDNTFTGLSALSYEWRSNGHLASRSLANIEEEFDYDGVNRLKEAKVSGTRTLGFTYDDLGNLKTKTSTVTGDDQVISMAYGTGTNVGPHALNAASLNGSSISIAYDPNGNVSSITNGSDVRTFTYDANNRVTDIDRGTTSLDFKYEPDGMRYYKARELPGYDTEHTFYLYGGVYQEARLGTASDGVQKTDVTSNIQHIVQASGSEQYVIFRRDHLGSIQAELTSTGAVIDTFGHDPFGGRRMADWSADISQTELDQIINNENVRPKRGFTDHEHLDRLDVVHMNGRIYEPTLGRFLNVDPIVQGGWSSQSYNRYSYVANSPLSFVDPSGYEREGDSSLIGIVISSGNYLELTQGGPARLSGLTGQQTRTQVRDAQVGEVGVRQQLGGDNASGLKLPSSFRDPKLITSINAALSETKRAVRNNRDFHRLNERAGLAVYRDVIERPGRVGGVPIVRYHHGTFPGNTPNLSAAFGLRPQQADMAGASREYISGAAALLVALPESYSNSALSSTRMAQHYNEISRNIDAPVFVTSVRGGTHLYLYIGEGKGTPVKIQNMMIYQLIEEKSGVR